MTYARLRNLGKSRLGETHGPYRVVRAVGADPETSEYYVLACPECDYELTVPRRSFARIGTRRKCTGCGRRADATDADSTHPAPPA